jgi:hypothetical protein
MCAIYKKAFQAHVGFPFGFVKQFIKNRKLYPDVGSFIPVVNLAVFFGCIGHPFVRRVDFNAAKFVFAGVGCFRVNASVLAIR